MSQTSREYWAERAMTRSGKLDRAILVLMPEIQEVYSHAERFIQQELAGIYRNYANETGLDIQALKQIAPAGKIVRAKKLAENVETARFMRENYNARLDYLELLRLEAHRAIKQAQLGERKAIDRHLAKTIDTSRKGLAKDINDASTKPVAFSTINRRKLDLMLNQRWSGHNYKRSVWRNNDALAKDISTRLTAGLLAGVDHAKLSREIRDRFGVHYYQASRLVRTETTYFENEAEASLAEELGVEYYKYDATIDSRTSEICGHLDGHIFKFAEREIGVNFPPMHPNCRSKAVMTVDPDHKFISYRRIRNENRETDADPSFVTNYRTYEEWNAPTPSQRLDLREIPAPLPELRLDGAVDPLIKADIQSALTEVNQRCPQATEYLTDIGVGVMTKPASGDKLTAGEFSGSANGVIEIGAKSINGAAWLNTINRSEAKITMMIPKGRNSHAKYSRSFAKTDEIIANTIKEAVCHELGHSLAFAIRLKEAKADAVWEQWLALTPNNGKRRIPDGKWQTYQKIQLKLNEIISAEPRTMIDRYMAKVGRPAKQWKEYAIKHISPYAGEDRHEMFAELFTGYMMGKRGKQWQTFAELLDETIKTLWHL